MTTQTEIIGLLSQRAMDLGELIVECCLKRNGPIPDMVIYYLQDLVRTGDVRVTKVDGDGRIVRRGKSTDYDRLLWSIPGKDIQLQPAAVTQPAAARKHQCSTRRGKKTAATRATVEGATRRACHGR